MPGGRGSSSSGSRPQSQERWPPPRSSPDQHPPPHSSERVHHSDVVLPPVNQTRPSEEATRPQLPPLSVMLGNRVASQDAYMPPIQHQMIQHGPGHPEHPMHHQGHTLIQGQQPYSLPIPDQVHQARPGHQGHHAQRTAVDEQNVAMQLFMADPDVLPRALDNGRFQCPLCPKNYKYAKHVRRHIINHTNLYPYTCPRCHALFRRKDAQRRHLQRIHPDLHPSSTRRSQPDQGPEAEPPLPLPGPEHKPSEEEIKDESKK